MEVVGTESSGVLPATRAARERVPRRPAGIDPTVPFEPISIGWNPLADRLGSISRVISDRLRLNRLTPALLRRRHPGPLDEGRAGAQLAREAGSLRVAVIGDYGDGDSRVARRIAAQVAAHRPGAVATVGDNVYPVGSERDWRRGFDPPDLYGALARRVRFHPALGNHDYYAGDLRPYFRRFPHLQGRPYYAWRAGEVDLFVLDTEQRLDAGSAQLAWLGAQLAASRAPYRVVQLHRPPWSSAGAEQPPSWRGDLGAVLARHGVQLVLAGHEHSYERTQPIEGVTYVVAGGGGASIFPFRAAQPAWSALRSRRSHFVELEQQRERLVVRAIDADGAVFDTVALAPRPIA